MRINRLWDFLGYDYFISYRQRDSADYALSLAERLSERNYACYLDRWNVQAGKEPRRQLSRGLRRSATLIMIGTDGAFDSSWVAWEVQEFSKHLSKPMFAISIDDNLGRKTLEGTPFEVFKEAAYHVEDATSVSEGRPSERVVSEVVARTNTAPKFQRKKWIIGMVILAIILTFALGLVVGRLTAGS